MKAVAITGLGVVSPLGIGAPAFFDALCAGRSGIAKSRSSIARRRSNVSFAVAGTDASVIVASVMGPPVRGPGATCR